MSDRLYTWDEIYERAMGQAYGSAELCAKDEACNFLYNYINNNTLIDLDEAENFDEAMSNYIYDSNKDFLFTEDGECVVAGRYKYEDCTVFGVETDKNGNRNIHFYGYIYDYGGSEDADCPYKVMEYYSYYCPFEDALSSDLLDYEITEGELQSAKTYFCSENQMIFWYETFDKGKKPRVCTKLTEDIDDGIYIYYSEKTKQDRKRP